MPFPRCALALPALAALACSSSSGGSGEALPERTAFSYLTNIIPVDIRVGGVTGTAVVDTGNPLVLLDPSVFTSVADLPADGGAVPSIVIGSVTAQNVYAIATNDGLASPDPAVPLAANLGCTAICSYVASFNYRDVIFGLGTTVPVAPTGTDPETVFGFSLAGGGMDSGITLPTSRVVVNVSIEGHSYAMILDTGASFVTLSQNAYATLTAAGRTQIAGGSVETTAGESTTSLTRAASLVVGGVEVDNVVVAHDTSFDTNLAAVSADAGQTIDGSLGGTFLHDFFVTIDYPASMIHLARYSDLNFAVDMGERLGIQLAEVVEGGFVVAEVSPTVAAQGVAVGDQVVSIGGVSLAGLQAAQASALQYGHPGTTRSVTFGAAALVAGQTLTIAVEELLPL